MEYRQVPGTDVSLPEISFGTGDNGGLITAGSQDERVAAVRAALDLGVNYFDTSPDYGKEAAEVNLGEAFRLLGTTPLVGTKIEIMPEDADDIAGKVRRSLEGSLRRLGVDHVDFLLVHNPVGPQRDPRIRTWMPLSLEDYLGDGGALEGLLEAKAAGKVRFLGAATEDAHPELVRELIDSGHFSLINVWLNLLNPSAMYSSDESVAVAHDYGRIIEYAGSHNVGVAVIRPLGGGVLATVRPGGARHHLAGGTFTRNPDLYEAASDAAFAFRALADRGVDLVQLSYRFILSHDAVTSVVGGFSEQSHLLDAVAQSGQTFSDSDRDLIRGAWKEMSRNGEARR